MTPGLEGLETTKDEEELAWMEDQLDKTPRRASAAEPQLVPHSVAQLTSLITDYASQLWHQSESNDEHQSEQTVPQHNRADEGFKTMVRQLCIELAAQLRTKGGTYVDERSWTSELTRAALHQLQLASTPSGSQLRARQVCRKHVDNVELMLLADMYDHEHAWTNYDYDQDQFKQQLNTQLFDAVVTEAYADLRTLVAIRAR